MYCIALQSENYIAQKTDNHSENQITKPGSNKLKKQHGSDNSSDSTPLHHIIPRCPDPGSLITQQQPLFKKYPFHPNWLYTSLNSDVPDTQAGHFESADSGLSLPPPPLKVRDKECIVVKQVLSSLYFAYFLVYHIFPNAATDTQQSNEKEGKSRQHEKIGSVLAVKYCQQNMVDRGMKRVFVSDGGPLQLLG